MRIIIAGAGKVGYYLAKTLLSKGHEVNVIEVEESRCLRIVEELNILTIVGDATDIHILADAGADEADVVAAVTGSDEENLLVCQMAKRKFSVGKTLARINNPKNERIFKELGVDITVSSTSLIAKSIEYGMDIDNMKMLLDFEREDVVILELDLLEKSPATGHKVRELADMLPEKFIFAAVFREESIILPKGDTELQAGDRIIAITASENSKAIKDTLLKSK